MIQFENPVFLLLLIPLLIFQFLRPFNSRSANILQLCINLLLVGALSGVQFKLPHKEGILFILCDRSFSMPRGSEKVMEKQIDIISQKLKTSPGIISFAGNTLVEQAPGNNNFKGFTGVLSNCNASSVNDALESALRLIPRGTPGRVLLMSDGNWNGISPENAFSAAVMRRIPVDFLPLKRNVVNDFAITKISAPLSVAPGEYCSIVCQIYAPYRALVKCRIRKDSGQWHTREVLLQPGMNHLFWRDRSGVPGVSRFEFALDSPQEDGVRENNFARHLMEVKGAGKILILTRSPSGNLGKLLAARGFEVKTLRPPSAELSPETLGSYRAVILENVPASDVGKENIALMAELVRSGRMGLLMTGGRQSFAAGGWYKTPVAEVLPVLLDKQHDIRQRRSAVMMALDRSGSMAATIDGVTKMSMANLAAAESYKLLSPEDEFGLIAVDSSVHQVAPLKKMKESADPTSAILAIESMGGGIFVDKALHEALRQLTNSKAPVRHLLLFADAADAEQPGNYKELLHRAVKAGITVSVVGLGGRDSTDAGLLMEIARRGNGKCYFADNASELPRIFAEDTFVMVRSSFVTGKTALQAASELGALPGAENIRGDLETGGYNLCFAREKSQVLLRTRDDEAAPIAVTGFGGLGKTAVLALEADGEYSGRFSTDGRGGTLLAALARYVFMPAEKSFNGCFITQNMRSGIFKSEILLDPERRKVPFDSTPVLALLVSGTDGKVSRHTLPFNWEDPDRLTASFLVPPGGTVNGAVEFSEGKVIPLAPVVHTISPEFQQLENKDISFWVRQTNGLIKSSFDDIGSLMQRQYSFYHLRPWLLGLAMILLLVQVWMRRNGWEFPKLRLKIPLKLDLFTMKRPSGRIRKRNKTPQKETPPEPECVPEKTEQTNLSEALKRAKRR